MSGRVKILKASAGSGKTYRLSFEYIKALVHNPRFYGSILAVTFTNKATAEMKRRILGELNVLALGLESPYMADLVTQTGLESRVVVKNCREALELILQDYSRFAVSTIDKFFQRIVRSFFKELDLDYNYTVELDSDSMLIEAVDRVIQRSDSDPVLAGLLQRMALAQMEQSGGWDIREPLIKFGNELFQERYKESDVEPEQVIELFAAIGKEVDGRLDELRQVCHRAMELMAGVGLEPSDFKQGKNSFAHYFAKVYSGKGIIAKYNSYFDKARFEPSECYTSKSPRRDDIVALLPQLTPLIQQVGDMYDALEPDILSVGALAANFNRYLLLSHLGRQLKQVWSERGRIPIHQTNRLIGQLVTGNDTPFIYEKVGTRYENYMIDEFQDTSFGQWVNFSPLLNEAVAHSDSQSVMLIGDVKQAIYRWRGGDWSLLSGVAGASFSGDVVDSAEKLNTNWRSAPRVIEFNNMLINRVVELDAEAIEASLGDGLSTHIELAYSDFRQSVPPHKVGLEQGYVDVESFDKENGVQELLLDRVGDILARGYSLSDIAVLVRVKNQGRQVAQILLGAGYGVVSDEALLVSESSVVEFVVSLFSLVSERQNGVNIALINKFVGNAFSAPLDDTINELLDRLAQLSPLEAMELVIEHFELNTARGLDGQVTYLQALYQMLYDYCDSNVPDMAGFLRWWGLVGVKRSMPMPAEQEAISIMTIHKSKGLEFKCVILPFVDWSLLPSTGGRTPTTLWVHSTHGKFDALPPLPILYNESLAKSYFEKDYKHETLFSHIDAVNMLYVAVTRAECELYMMYPKPSSSETKAKPTTPKTVAVLLEQALGEQRYVIGEKGGGKSKSKEPLQANEVPKELEFDDFPTHYSGGGIRTSWASERYFENLDTTDSRLTAVASSARRIGLLLHSLLERIDTLSQANEVLAQMRSTGQVSPQQVEVLDSTVQQMALNPTIGEWFEQGWESYNERTILTPQGGTYRPDRVVWRTLESGQTEAIVIDYKFGNLKRADHTRQVQNYVELLAKMKYNRVRGYVWYIESGEVIEI